MLQFLRRLQSDCPLQRPPTQQAHEIFQQTMPSFYHNRCVSNCFVLMLCPQYSRHPVMPRLLRCLQPWSHLYVPARPQQDCNLLELFAWQLSQHRRVLQSFTRPHPGTYPPVCSFCEQRAVYSGKLSIPSRSRGPATRCLPRLCGTRVLFQGSRLSDATCPRVSGFCGKGYLFDQGMQASACHPCKSQPQSTDYNEHGQDWTTLFGYGERARFYDLLWF